MIKRGWLTPILVSIICIVVLFSYQSKQFGQSHASYSNLPQIPWEKDLSEITQLDVVSGTQKISIIRDNDSWKMTSPVTSAVDAAYLYDALSYILKPPILSTVASPVTDLKSYGIDHYSKSISIIDKEGKTYELICGNQVDQTSYYAYEPLSQTIYTIDKNAFDKMSSNLNDWRERRYIDFDPNTIATIKLQFQGKTHVLTQSIVNNEATFSSEGLSEDTINRLLSFIKTTRVQQFIADNATNEIISSYGFDDPSFRIVIASVDGTKQVFDINTSAPDTTIFYVLDRQNNNIYTIPSFELRVF